MSFDPILTLASSLDAIPGSHAVLLGAGISIAAGVPSAWGVQEELIRRLAALGGETEPAEPHQWYREKFGHNATYESLLEGIAPQPQERQGVLRGIFEPETLNPDAPRPEPSAAHLALADLAASGAVRVFLTLNFDHLMEQALRARGIEPTVVRSVADLEGLAPLHTLRAVVVHLHGDYLTPSAMRNTVQELAEYEPPVQDFLAKVLSEHALLIVGWSAEYDPALRQAVQKSLLERFTSYWVTRGGLGPLASELATACRITHVAGDADPEIGRLRDAFVSVQSRQARHPLTLHDAVAAVKRELSGQSVAVGVHDRLRSELARLRDHPALSLPNYHAPADSYAVLTGRLAEAASTTAGLVAATAYWGSPSTDRWWLSELPRFSAPVRGDGLTELLALPQYAGTLLYQAAAVGALASGRLDLVLRLISTSAEPHYEQTDSLARRLAALHGFGRSATPSAAAVEVLRPVFVEHLAIGWRAYEEAWELFDILVLAQQVYEFEDFEHRYNAVISAETELDAAEVRFQAAQASNDLDEHDDAQQARYRASQEAGRTLGRVADCAWPMGHIRYTRTFTNGIDGHGATRVRTLLRELERENSRHPLVSAGFAGGDPHRLRVALEAVSVSVGRQGQMARSSISRVIPGYFWADTSEVPSY